MLRPLILQIISVIIFICWGQLLNAQIFSQNLKGTVRDKASASLMKDVLIEVIIDQKSFRQKSDTQGSFRFFNLKVGKLDISFQKEGYRIHFIKQIELTSGKELLVDVELEEKVIHLSEVSIHGVTTSRNISSSVLTSEQIQKIPGAFRDPARMLAQMAGISNPDDRSNALVVRGTSPVGVQWLIEGLEMINPNHFANIGNVGAAVSMLNPETISKIEFYTGAFPAQYGNALSGVFDVNLRRGNSDKREFHVGTSIIDIEAVIEGPINKDKNSSYLLAYRRANLDLAYQLHPLVKGQFGNAPKVEDFTAKLHFPHENGNITSIYALGGKGNIRIRSQPNSEEEQISSSENWVAGISHTHFFNEKSYLKYHLAYARSKITNGSKYFDTSGQLINNFLDDAEQRIGLALTYNQKLSAKHRFQLGLLAYHRLHDFKANFKRTRTDSLSTLNLDISHQQYQAFARWAYQPTDYLKFRAGVHALYLTLNATYNIEPRFSVSWQIAPMHRLAARAGLYSRRQPTSIYFSGLGPFELFNKKLDLSKSLHYTLSYQTSFFSGFNTLIEAYYLNYFNIVDLASFTVDSPGKFGLNYGSGLETIFFRAGIFDNRGKGRSLGLEFSTEKKLNNGFYTMLNASIYDAKYEEDGKLYPTAFNGKYQLNTVLGKQFLVNILKNNYIDMNWALSLAGGRPYTPRIPQRLWQEDLSRIFESKYKDYFRVDLKLSWKQNLPKFTQTVSLDIRNLFNTKNELYKRYSFATKSVEIFYQIGILPLIFYQVEF